MAAIADCNQEASATFRVTLPRGVIDDFEDNLNGCIRNRVFAAALLRYTRLINQEYEHAWNCWLNWRDSPERTRYPESITMRKTTVRLPVRLIDLFNKMEWSYPDTTRSEHVSAALLSLRRGPKGQCVFSLELDWDSYTVAWWEYLRWRDRVDDEFMAAVQGLWRAAGEEPPKLHNVQRPPIEPCYGYAGSIETYARRGGCMSDDQVRRLARKV